MAAREAATSDVAGLNSFTDKMLQGRAAAVMGDTADQHPAYKTSLKEASPQYAGLAERAYADGQQRSAAKEDRKAFEFADRRDDAADNIATRYATMARAGLTVKDLQGPALDRLAIKDSRDLLLIDGFPPHPRAGEAKALVDRAAERGWEAVRLIGSPEFVRQGWIAATAQGLKAVGHTPHSRRPGSGRQGTDATSGWPGCVGTAKAGRCHPASQVGSRRAGERRPKCGREQRATPACGRN